MKSQILTTAAVLLIVLISFTHVMAQDTLKGNPYNKGTITNVDGKVIQHGYRFIDKDGDGYNDNAPDHDGDGVPNGVDSDYQGSKFKKGRGNRRYTAAGEKEIAGEAPVKFRNKGWRGESRRQRCCCRWNWE